MSMPQVHDHAIVLDLLDSATGHPMQTWRFTGQSRILIGRAPDGDVVVSNPYVSRSHAYLEYDAGLWQVVAISNHQILIGERRLQTAELFEGCVFRLGSNGCSLRFRRDSLVPAVSDSGQTLSLNPEIHPFLQLDRDQLRQDVDQIANGSFFHDLTKNLQRLRRERKETADSE